MGRGPATSTLHIVADRRESAAPAPDAPPPGNLPADLTTFVGREAELREIETLLANTRLLTLSGAGGSGKTRLALQVTRNHAGALEDRAWWVDLAPLSDPDLVPQRVAQALGVPEAPGRPVMDLLIDHLRSRSALLVLDNCEHMVGACAELADVLLRSCPDVRILATSREPLGVAGEVSWTVPPLPLPDARREETPDGLLRFGAVGLFVDRARDAAPAFALTGSNARTVARLCARLDGMPLAIERAAARTRALSPAQILERIDDRFRLLTGARTASPRHRTLLATMEWSHDLLSEKEKITFRRLSVFAGGWTLDAAEAVCSGGTIGAEEVLELLSCLVDKSLVAVSQGEQVRYRMLETVRQYASDLLDDSAEEEEVRDGHADFFLTLAERAEPGLMGQEQRVWLARLEVEHDNLAAALSWLLRNAETSRGLEMAGALGRFWWFGGHFDEGRGFIEGFLGMQGAEARTAERAKALHALGLATFWHETEAAGVGDSRERFEEAIDIYRELGDRRRLAIALKDLGGYWKGRSGTEEARSVLSESLTLCRETGDELGIGAAKGYLGIMATYAGEIDAARSYLEDALFLLRARGGTDEIMRCIGFLAHLACDTDDPATARARFRELASLDPLTTVPYTAGFVLQGVARLAVVEKNPELSLKLAGAAASTHERIGTSAGPAYDAYVGRGLEPAWSVLGREAGEAAFQEGRTWTFEEAMARVMEGESSPPEDPSGVLRPREIEVLRLVADGLSDAQAAEKLYVSRRTVGNHLSSAYRKLGVGNRTAAVKKAVALGLI
jgi:predicted ATPase/DNA-binding CsgD family transcriptional regulator